MLKLLTMNFVKGVGKGLGLLVLIPLFVKVAEYYEHKKDSEKENKILNALMEQTK